MTPAHAFEPIDAVSFLVVDAGDSLWGVEIAHVVTVLDGLWAHDALDAAQLGAPGDPAFPPRVLELRSPAGDRALAVRGKLAVVTVARDEIQDLPALVTARMARQAFSSVAIGDDHAPFLILDVEAALRRTT